MKSRKPMTTTDWVVIALALAILALAGVQVVKKYMSRFHEKQVEIVAVTNAVPETLMVVTNSVITNIVEDVSVVAAK
jgi:hypothetical protein